MTRKKRPLQGGNVISLETLRKKIKMAAWEAKYVGDYRYVRRLIKLYD